MALCVSAILPILILFVAIQKYFVQGVVLSGMKA
jgi:ABC-type glycerol-3-phosphate transport system permease component